jgi:hypothetical protein
MATFDPINRREFMASAAAFAASFTIVPSNVIAGLGKIPPSDQITVANIGCGSMRFQQILY